MKTLDLHIIDITHNSIRAGATEITIEMEDSAARDLLSIKIIDNRKSRKRNRQVL